MHGKTKTMMNKNKKNHSKNSGWKWHSIFQRSPCKMSKLPLFNYRNICFLCNNICKHLYKLSMILICSKKKTTTSQVFPRPYLRLVLEVLSTRYIIKMQKIADPNNLCQIVYNIVTKNYTFPLAIVIIKLNSS